MPMIKLQSSDGEVFQVDFEIAKASVTIKTMVEVLGLEEKDEGIVPLPYVKAGILKKVIEWATYHKDDPLPAENDEGRVKRTDDICSWDADFLKANQRTLYQLTNAAYYLGIKGLSDVTKNTFTNMIKGKTAKEIREMFNIENYFTAAVEDQIPKEDEWLRKMFKKFFPKYVFEFDLFLSMVYYI